MRKKEYLKLDVKSGERSNQEKPHKEGGTYRTRGMEGFSFGRGGFML